MVNLSQGEIHERREACFSVDLQTHILIVDRSADAPATNHFLTLLASMLTTLSMGSTGVGLGMYENLRAEASALRCV